MADHTNAELIAASETWTPAEVHASPVGAARIIESLAAALETAEQRAKEAERELQVAEDQANNLAGDLAQAEKERDEARKAAEDHVLDADAVHVRLSAELRAAEQRAEEAERERNALAAVIEKARTYMEEERWDDPGFDPLAILSSAPQDVLREVKADVWAEGVNAEARAAVTASPRIKNPYRKEQSGV